MEEREIYTIGRTAIVTGISSKTLRYYDSLNLIVPKIRNPQNNYRYYSKDQVVALIAVQRLRIMGCGLKALRAVVEGNSLAALYEQVCYRMDELNQEIATRQATINENLEFVNRLKEAIQLQEHSASFDKYLLNNARIEEIPKIHLFCEERTMPNYNVMDTSVNFRAELYAKCKASGLQSSGSEVTTYYTNLLGQFVMHDCKIRIGITVENNLKCNRIQEFGGFTAATAIHMGAYDKMVNTHMMLLQWINRNGYEVNGEVSEEFLISPIDILDQKNQIIKVIMPVCKLPG